MRVALYKHHQCLPSGNSPAQPNIMFNPDVMRGWKDQNEVLAANHWAWGILMGLHLIKSMPSVLAHVSVCFDSKRNYFEIPEKVWIQFTTMPSEVGRDGIPIVIKSNKGGRKFLVENLWSIIDDNVKTPLDFLDDGCYRGEEKNANFWQDFFTARLLAAKEEVKDEYEEAERKRDLFLVVHG